MKVVDVDEGMVWPLLGVIRPRGKVRQVCVENKGCLRTMTKAVGIPYPFISQNITL